MASGERQPADGLRNAGPDPKRFTVADGQLLNIASAAFPFLIRAGTGGFASGYSTGLKEDDGTYGVVKVSGRSVAESSKVSTFKRPAKPLELYEFQGCPFCRKVREAISVLDLDAAVFPCPQGGPTWRPKAVELGGKAQFPYLVDPNTGASMYESDAIIAYLFKEYGDGAVPLALRLGPLTTLTCGLALAPRVGKGSRYTPSNLPAKPLVLWGYELSPFVVVVKEVLSELELPYLQVTTSRGSPKRQLLFEKRGTFQVPYLEDENEGVYLFESSAIIDYLYKNYKK
ncbi:hypothetical protein Rsub_02948 [Raphidocelis subcapitata]|uniref:GST N-terminal domain-containing protein n=1 Tax=Raphidocelis subcapitata TaxID=307507 RepID=A0A2V0NQ52_9CHLO|nr:hypothetical protein Rsub_02948 [Raphidocelis subcapitata]|eukprot:GBF89778.1 hypothetical protein Rsub_02948 [Raphidocelis subcapitata]